MSLDDLYKEVILDHYQNPRNKGRLAKPDVATRGHNPLCGDRLTVWLQMKDDLIEDVAFQGSGCAISRASASLMTVAVKGKRKVEAEDLFEQFRRLVTGTLPSDQAPSLGKLAAFAGVAEYQVRVKCAGLPWHTLRAALVRPESVVSTE